MEPSREPERSALFVPLARMAESSGRHTWLIVAGWVLGLAGVAAVGIGGHERGSTAAVAPVPVAPFASAAPAASNLAPSMPHATAPIVHHRSLGDDGLVGGIVFGDNVSTGDGPD